MATEGVMISQMVSETTIDGTEQIPTLQGGDNRKITMAQLESYLEARFASVFAPLDSNPLLATLQAIFPVGSLYINASNNANPATLLGFGTWAAVTDKFIIGAGNSYAVGATGGEATHTLTAAELPSHSHKIPGGWLAAAGGAVAVTSPAVVAGTSDSGSTGGGAAHNNLPPYVAYYIWRRVS